MADYDDIFDDDGALELPTMRGSANLDVEDYEKYSGDSSILDDDLQEDTLSTPGFNPGAAPAPDIDGTDDYEPEVEDDDEPGMAQTTYGNHPWGPGASGGYRPHSQQRTDMELRALGDESAPQPKPRERDSMMMEPEVLNAVAVGKPVPWDREWHGNQNQLSNEDLDPDTIYDRSSYERHDSTQSTIGSGIFSMEEGATWRPRDGIFAHQYALPEYIGAEDELGVQQSDMWDTTADDWRTTQVSGGGVAFTKNAPRKPPPNMSGMRPEVTGPRSHVEAFGRKAAKLVIAEAQMQPPENRSRFLNAAVDSLGTGTSAKASQVAQKLIQLGYRPDVALEDVLAHAIMHATAKDLTQPKFRSSALPRLDALASKIKRTKPAMQNAAVEHLHPLTQDPKTLKGDLGALYASPAARGMGQVAEGGTQPAVSEGVFTAKNLLIAGAVGGLGYVLFANRKAIVKNIKKVVG